MRLTNDALQRILTFIDGDINYLSIDSGAAGQVYAGGEVYRNTIVPVLRDGTTTILEHFIDETRVIPVIGGFYLLSAATETPGTGVVFASQTATDSKAYGESLTVSVEVTIVEVT